MGKRCGDNFDERVGSPEGACDALSETLQKVMGLGLWEAMEDESFPEELRSPAYNALSNYQMSELQLGDIFENWKEVGIDHWGYDPREAVSTEIQQQVAFAVVRCISHSSFLLLNFTDLSLGCGQY